jgi:predicted glutamate--cysteine ligase
VQSQLPAQSRAEDLVSLADANETAAATNSLDAELRHWVDGRTILARDWIAELYEEMTPLAKERGFACFLSPLTKILRQGNQAQQWLKLYEGGTDIRSAIAQEITAMIKMEHELEDKLCQQLVA